MGIPQDAFITICLDRVVNDLETDSTFFNLFGIWDWIISLSEFGRYRGDVIAIISPPARNNIRLDIVLFQKYIKSNFWPVLYRDDTRKCTF